MRATKSRGTAALAEIRAELQRMLPDLRRRWPIRRVGVFGSYARGEQGPASDLDLLVDFEGPVSYFDLFDLEQEVGRRLGVKVEVTTRAALKPLVRERVLADLVAV
jgi:hypothetical protein